MLLAAIPLLVQAAAAILPLPENIVQDPLLKNESLIPGDNDARLCSDYEQQMSIEELTFSPYPLNLDASRQFLYMRTYLPGEGAPLSDVTLQITMWINGTDEHNVRLPLGEVYHLGMRSYDQPTDVYRTGIMELVSDINLDRPPKSAYYTFLVQMDSRKRGQLACFEMTHWLDGEGRAPRRGSDLLFLHKAFGFS